MQEINRLVYSSRIVNIKAMDKLILSFVVLALTLYLNNIATGIITILVMSTLNISLSKIGFKKYILLCLIPLGFLVVSIISILIEFNATSYLVGVDIFGLKLGVTSKGIIRGINIATRSFASLVCMYFFVLNTRIEDIIGLLRKCKLPIMIVNLIEMIYRFIFILIDEITTINYAIRSRGGGVGLKGKVKLIGLALSRVMTSSLSRAERIDYSIKSRGYKGNVRYLDRDVKSSIVLNILTVVIGCIQIAFSLI